MASTFILSPLTQNGWRIVRRLCMSMVSSHWLSRKSYKPFSHGQSSWARTSGEHATHWACTTEPNRGICPVRRQCSVDGGVLALSKAAATSNAASGAASGAAAATARGGGEGPWRPSARRRGSSAQVLRVFLAASKPHAKGNVQPRSGEQIVETETTHEGEVPRFQNCGETKRRNRWLRAAAEAGRSMPSSKVWIGCRECAKRLRPVQAAR